MNKKLNIIIFFFVFSGLSLQALPKGTLEAEHISSSYNKVILSGDVKIKYDIGEITAGKVVLSKLLPNDSVEFDLMKLTEDVNIKFRDSSKVNCHLANINYRNLTATFFSGGTVPRVVYNDNILNESGDIINILMKSKTMNLNLIKNGSLYDIKNIFAQCDVDIQYGSNIVARSQRAIYHNIVDADKNKEGFAGIIFLMSANSDDICYVEEGENNKIEAKEVRFDMNEEKLFCSKMKASMDQNQDRSFLASADHSVWEIKTGSLFLRENVAVNHTGFGTITCEGSLDLQQKKMPNGDVRQNIVANGMSSWTFYDHLKGDRHNIISPEKMEMDDCSGQVVFHSSPIEQLSYYEPLMYSNKIGKMYSDSMRIDYSHVKKDIEVDKVLIDGNIRIVNTVIGDDGEAGGIARYILADSADYSPGDNIIILRSIEGKNVLILDKINDIQISADAIAIDLGDVKGTESVRGLGKVRFVFSEEELLLFNEKFNL